MNGTIPKPIELGEERGTLLGIIAGHTMQTAKLLEIIALADERLQVETVDLPF